MGSMAELSVWRTTFSIQHFEPNVELLYCSNKLNQPHKCFEPCYFSLGGLSSGRSIQGNNQPNVRLKANSN